MDNYDYLQLPSIEIKYANRSKSYNMRRPHQHNTYEIYYLLEGEINYFIKDRTYPVQKGDLVLIPPHVIHRTTSANANGHKRLLINIKESYIKPLIEVLEPYDWFACFLTATPVYSLELAGQKAVLDHLFHLLHLNENAEGDNAIKLSIMELLILLNKEVPARVNTKLPSKSNPKEDKVFEIVKFINHHYAQAISLQVLEKEFYLSTYYISRVFKEVTGFSFNEYLNEVRILEAKKFLRNKSLTITQVSELVGYESITHFGRVFKKVAYVSPREYRKSI